MPFEELLAHSIVLLIVRTGTVHEKSYPFLVKKD